MNDGLHDWLFQSFHARVIIYLLLNSRMEASEEKTKIPALKNLG
jgi:hypothetical protein